MRNDDFQRGDRSYRGNRNLDSDYGTREFTSQVYGEGERRDIGSDDFERGDRPRRRMSGDDFERGDRRHGMANTPWSRGTGSDRSGYGRQDFNRDNYGSRANYGYDTDESNDQWSSRRDDGRRGLRGSDSGYFGGSDEDRWSSGGSFGRGMGDIDRSSERRDDARNRGGMMRNRVNAEYSHSNDSGREGWATQGSQDYGRYDINDLGNSRSSGSQRQYGLTSRGSNYGVYDIGGQGAQGFSRGSNNTYDDIDYGTRHWGHGEFDDRNRRDTSRSSGGDDRNVFEKMGEAVGRFFGVGPKGYRRSDDRIREEVSEALARHPDIDASDIEVDVKDGHVTLSGTVDSRRTKRLVEDEIEHLSGVRDIINNLRSKQYSSGSDTTLATGYPSGATDTTSPSDHLVGAAAGISAPAMPAGTSSTTSSTSSRKDKDNKENKTLQ